MRVKFFLLILALLLSSCALFQQSQTADNLSKGGEIIVEKTYFEDESPKQYKVIYRSSRDVSGGFNGKIKIQETETGWLIIVTGKGDSVITHATEAIDADKIRAQEAGSAAEKIAEGVVKGLIGGLQ